MKRFILPEEFSGSDKYPGLLDSDVLAHEMRAAVNDLNHDGPDEYCLLDVYVMDYFLMNSYSACRESDIVRVVNAMANDRSTEADVRDSLKRLSRNGKNKFLRIRRSAIRNGRSERLYELNYFRADELEEAA